MIDSTPAPSPLLTFSAIAAKWSLRVVAAVWLVFAVLWASLHFVIVPRIDASRLWLEQLASQRLGVSVHIGAIAAQSHGLSSSISLHNVVMSDAHGQPALHLPALRAEISVQSLLSLGTDQLFIDSPALHVRRTPDGQMWVAGIPIPTDNSDPNNPVADWVLSQPEILLQRGVVHWFDEQRGTPAVTLTGVDVALRHSLLSHTLKLEAIPPASWGERISVSAASRKS
jgi:uncharacterized protein YhdP